MFIYFGNEFSLSPWRLAKQGLRCSSICLEMSLGVIVAFSSAFVYCIFYVLAWGFEGVSLGPLVYVCRGSQLHAFVLMLLYHMFHTEIELPLKRRNNHLIPDITEPKCHSLFYRCHSTCEVPITKSFIWEGATNKHCCRCWHWDNRCWFRPWGFTFRVC